MRRTPLRRRRATPRRRQAPRWTAADWSAAEPLLQARARGLCECCGRPLRGRAERSHRVRRRDGGDRLANLLLLLPEHHAAAHAHPRWAGDRGVILPSTADPAATPVLLHGRTWVYLHDDGTTTACQPPPWW